MSEKLRGLSLTQPWATLVAIGAKQIETRSWSNPYRGWIAIHASKAYPKWAQALCLEEPFNSTLRQSGIVIAPENLPLGAIVALANLHKIGLIGRHPESGAVIVRGQELPIIHPHELAFGDFTAGRFGWVITGVRRLSTPIPCQGKLGLWPVPADIAAEIWRRVEETA